MYGVVMHDYMRDMLNSEFVLAYGKTEKEAAESAWAKLKTHVGDYIKELRYDDGTKVTKQKFVSGVIDNKDSTDGLFISEPYSLYVKLFEIPVLE